MKDARKTKTQLIRELAELRESESRLREFFVNEPVNRFLLLDSDLNIVAGNEILLKLLSGFFNVKRENLIGRNFPELIPGFKGSDRHRKYLEVLKTGIPFYTDELVPPPEAGDVRISVSVFKAGDGIGIIATDITERLRVEKALRESEQKYAALVEQAEDGVVILQDEVLKFANKAMADLLGSSVDELLGKNLLNFVTPEYRDMVAERYRLRFAGKTLPPYELKIQCKDGTTRDVETSANLIEYEGRPASVAVVRDITERKRTAEALRESEERFRALFEGALDATFLAVPESGEIVDVNPAASELLLLDQDEITGLTLTKLVPPRLEADAGEIWSRIVEEREEAPRFETLVLRSDGKEVPVELMGQMIQIDGVPFVIADLRDVSKRKEAEEVLQKTTERYRAFFDEAPTALWEIDASYAKDYSNRLRSKGVCDFKAYFQAHPEEAGRCERKVKLVEVNEASVKMFEAGTKGELLANIGRIVRPDPSNVFSGGIVAVAEGRTSFERELTAYTLKGKKKDFFYKWSVFPGCEETYSRLLVSLADITDRKLLEQELLKSQKLDSLGVLAGGIAHDFNNLLTAISTNLSMARMYGNLEDDISEMLEDAERASSRARNLTQQLLVFAKGGKPVKTTVSLPRLLKDTADFALSGSNVKSVCTVPEDLWHISADEGQVGQVIHNLVINADQAMPGGGDIEISAENVIIGEEDQVPLKEGRYVRVSVTDHGIGISKKHLSRVFDPFFTTKQKGSGLGLTTCFTITKNHGGHIRVHSEVDVGTRIDVFLPAAEDTSETGKRKEERSLRGEGRILLIDDEEVIRRAADQLLTRFGYEVTLAKDGEEGLRYYREAGDRGLPFHAVIMDLTIRGGKGGKETIEELLEIDPDAKVIVSSGYSDDPVLSRYEDHGFCGVLMKPYKIEDVSEVLHRVLSDGKGN